VIDSDISFPPDLRQVFVPQNLEIPTGVGNFVFVDYPAMVSGYSLNVFNCSVS